MKKILIATAIAASFIAPQAFAQTKNFEGFSVAGNVNLNSATTEVTSSGIGINGVGKQDTNASLQDSYSYAASDDVLLSVGGTYNLSDVEAGKISSGSTTATFKLQKGASIYFEPGYLLSEKTLGYAKISYNSGTVEAASGTTSYTKGISGTGVGFGVRTILSKNLFLQVEANRIQFDSARFSGDATDFKTSATVASVGIGYKF